VEDVYEQLRLEAQVPVKFTNDPGEQATIGVLDTFRTADSEHPKHGDHVHAVLLHQGFQPIDTAKISTDISSTTSEALSSLLYEEGPEPFGQRLDAYIELTAGQSLGKTNGIFRQLAADPDLKLKTLNQSQGESRLGIYMLLLGAAYNGRKDGKPLLTDTGKKMAEVCGHQPDAPGFSGWGFNQSLIDRVNQVIDGSEHLGKLQSEHSELLEKLKARGITVVASAGNDNDDYMSTRDIFGHTIPESFDDDLTSVGDKVVVGALDDKGTPDKSDDEIAHFSSRYSAVTVLADGIDVVGFGGQKVSGTSFAAPKVAATLEQLRRQRPELSPEELRRETALLFSATDGYNLL
jgi:hypothetical protein